MPEQTISYAQNGEDIVLLRALGDIAGGRYLEVGANDPVEMSITKLFYDRGWSGVTVEPVPEFADAQRAARPRDTLVQAAVTDSGAEEVTLHVFGGTGLSTLDAEIASGHASGGFTETEITVPATSLQKIVDDHLADQPVHFCVIDVEGAEEGVLRSVDFTRFRPWVLVIEATKPLSTDTAYEQWEPLVTHADYRFCLFDGISRFYVAAEHADLADKLSYAASTALDDFATLEVARLRGEVTQARTEADTARAAADSARTDTDRVRGDFEQFRASTEAGLNERNDLREQVVYWRGQVLAHWSKAAAQIERGPAADPDAGRELEAIRNTVSWRVTAPLRTVRRRLPGGASR